ncbi:MAG: choice-of-anchor Q domain-containing protein [Flavobacteriales bacterium]
MKQIGNQLIILIAAYIPLLSAASNYYVSPSGNNSNSGLMPETPFETLNYASNQTSPGDTVFAMNGTYTNNASMSNVLNIYESGTEGNGIVYINYPGHTPLIQVNENNWSGVAIQGADYITIDGFHIVGNNDAITLEYALEEQLNTGNPATSANGIGITREYGNISNKPHHNAIRNCTISKCGGAGIYTYWADYTTIENNTVFECAWYSPYGNSGISLYQNWNSDSTQNFRNYILRNTCYRNENYIPFIAVGSITDGNGIIIDDNRNTQNDSDQGLYLGKTYIANNLIFDNGGRGIHVYLSDDVVIVNNTCYKNCQSPAIDDGEFTAYEADSIYILNNIAFPSANIPPIDQSDFSTTNFTVDHNLWGANNNLANPFGTNTVFGNPNFIMPDNNPLMADFHLLSVSNAINSGTTLFAPAMDKDGNLRLSTDSIDIGCYEFQSVTSISDIDTKEMSYIISPNPFHQRINVLNAKGTEKYALLNQLGQIIYSGKLLSDYDFSGLPDGVYYLRIATECSSETYKIVRH